MFINYWICLLDLFIRFGEKCYYHIRSMTQLTKDLILSTPSHQFIFAKHIILFYYVLEKRHIKLKSQFVNN